MMANQACTENQYFVDSSLKIKVVVSNIRLYQSEVKAPTNNLEKPIRIDDGVAPTITGTLVPIWFRIGPKSKLKMEVSGKFKPAIRNRLCCINHWRELVGDRIIGISYHIYAGYILYAMD
jgi:hypothetical protein